VKYVIGGVEYAIPSYMEYALRLYIDEGHIPGGFLRAVLENDLKGAVNRADSNNLRNLVAYSYFLYNDAPADCYGSPAAVAAWAKAGGLKGKAAKVAAAAGKALEEARPFGC